MRARALVLVLLAAACGSTTITTGSDAGKDASAGSAGASDSGTDAAAASGGFANIGGDATIEPGSTWADSGPIDGGPFDCAGCICDGATSFCYLASAGAPAPILRGLTDAAVCDDSGASRCFALPAACAGNPSCACLGATQQFSPACTCDDSGGGITVHCAFP